MRLLSRLLTVLVLLAVLAYGSYAFGKHVLSTRLFGRIEPSATSGDKSAKVARSVTRRIDLKGSKPRVEMQVLPATSAGPGPEPPSLTEMPRGSKGRKPVLPARPSIVVAPPSPEVGSLSGSASSRRRGERDIDSGVSRSWSSSYREGRERDEEERPRRKRRRRRRRVRQPSEIVQERRYDSGRSASQGDRSGEPSSDGSASRSSSGRRRGDSDSPASSPVPQPEGTGTSGSGGGDTGGSSPLPQPE